MKALPEKQLRIMQVMESGVYTIHVYRTKWYQWREMLHGAYLVPKTHNPYLIQRVGTATVGALIKKGLLILEEYGDFKELKIYTLSPTGKAG